MPESDQPAAGAHKPAQHIERFAFEVFGLRRNDKSTVRPLPNDELSVADASVRPENIFASQVEFHLRVFEFRHQILKRLPDLHRPVQRRSPAYIHTEVVGSSTRISFRCSPRLIAAQMRAM